MEQYEAIGPSRSSILPNHEPEDEDVGRHHHGEVRHQAVGSVHRVRRRAALGRGVPLEVERRRLRVNVDVELTPAAAQGGGLDGSDHISKRVHSAACGEAAVHVGLESEIGTGQQSKFTFVLRQ